MPAADIVEIRKSVIAAIGAAPTWGGAIDDDRRTQGEIDHQIVSADDDVIRLVLETDEHPLRPDYVADSALIAHGAKLPSSIGPRGAVEIQVNTGDAVFKLGQKASRAEIELWRRNANGIFGALAHDDLNSPLGGFFRIEKDKIYFTGFRARMTVGALTPNYAAPVCQGPVGYTPAIEARAIIRLQKEGDIDTKAFDAASKAWPLYEAMVRAGQLQLTQQRAA